jgi:hypothetical protein
MHARARCLVLAAIALVIPALGSAQSNPTNTQASTGPAAGPTIATSATAFRAVSVQPADSASMAMQRQNVGQPVALMVVGGAAILVGAVIGDAPGTLFMIGGAIALLYGLYKYLQ